MAPEESKTASGRAGSVSRRTVLTNAAWATPVIVTSIATPSLAASGTVGEIFWNSGSGSVQVGTSFSFIGHIRLTSGTMPDAVELSAIGANASALPPTVPVTETGLFLFDVTMPAVGTLKVTVSVPGEPGIIPSAELVVVTEGVSNFATAVAAGGGFCLALSKNGTLYGWGENFEGQLGNGSTAYNVPTPVRANTNAKFSQIAAGSVMSIGLDTEGNVHTWGWGTPVPTQVTHGTTFSQVDASSFYMALDRDGQAWAWGGNNGSGELGIGVVAADTAAGAPNRPTVPTRVNTSVRFVRIVAGTRAAAALTAAGDVYVWGTNGDGNIGLGSTLQVSVPTRLSLPQPIAHIQALAQGMVAIGVDGTVYCWGSSIGSSKTPWNYTFGKLAGIAQLATTSESITLLKGDGSAVALGSPYGGVFANASNSSSFSTPTAVLTGHTVRQVSGSRTFLYYSKSPSQQENRGGMVGDTYAYGAHYVGLDASGAILTWGANRTGQRGNGVAERDTFSSASVAANSIPFRFTLPDA